MHEINRKTLDEFPSNKEFFNNIIERVTNPKTEEEREQQYHFTRMKEELLKDFKLATDNPSHLKMRASEMAEMPDEKRRVNFGVLGALVHRGGFFTSDEHELVKKFLEGAIHLIEEKKKGTEFDDVTHDAV